MQLRLSFREPLKRRRKLTHSTHNFPDEMGEFIPGVVEKVAMRAGILIQAKAHN